MQTASAYREDMPGFGLIVVTQEVATFKKRCGSELSEYQHSIVTTGFGYSGDRCERGKNLANSPAPVRNALVENPGRRKGRPLIELDRSRNKGGPNPVVTVGTIGTGGEEEN